MSQNLSNKFLLSFLKKRQVVKKEYINDFVKKKLAEPKEDVKVGQRCSVFVKNIIPEKMKVKLIIVDAFDSDYMPRGKKYFIEENYIDE